MNRSLLTTVFLCFTQFICITNATTYYLDAKNGNDINSGRLSTQAWKTLDHLRTNVSLGAGDKVYLMPGNYSGWIFIQTSSASSSYPVSILAYDNSSSPVLLGGPGVTPIDASYTNGVVIRGLTFYRYQYSQCMDIWMCSHVTIENCTFIENHNDSDQPAVTIWSDDSNYNTTQTHIIVRRNIFQDWTGAISLMITQAINVLVEDNLFTGSNEYATQFYNTAKSYFRNNVITDSLGGFIIYCEKEWDATANVIENNRIENVQDFGFLPRAINTIVRNNYVSNSAYEAALFFSDDDLITNGTKFYGNVLYNGANSYETSAALTLDAWNLTNNVYMGTYIVKNNVIAAFMNDTMDTTALKIDYDPYENTSIDLFGSNGWQIIGNCMFPDKIQIQGTSYTIDGMQSESLFSSWIVGNVLFSDSDFRKQGDPFSGLKDSSTCKKAQVPLTTITLSLNNSNTIFVQDSRYFMDGADIMNGDTIVFGDCREIATIETIYNDTIILLTTNVSVIAGEGVTLLSLAGCSTDSKNEDPNKILFIILIVGGGALVLLIGSTVTFVIMRRRRKRNMQTKPHHEENGTSSVAMESTTPAPSSTLATHQIKILEVIGEGKFGAVYKGMFNKTTPVACKKLKSENKGIEFSREVALLSKLRHPNIIMFHGIWLSPESEEYMVFEFVNKGSLLTLLQQEKHLLNIDVLLNMALQVASGMSYLEQMKIVHRDLAARNVLVKEEGGTFFLKISDFGLSRQTSDSMYQGNDNELPVRWTAPEALIYNTHSHKSDVWSFGILLWEMYEYGKTPYPQFTNAVTRQKVVEGYRLGAPKECPQSVFELVQKCWHEKPNQRPSFAEIEGFFSQNMEDAKPISKPPKHNHSSTNAYMQVHTNNHQQENYKNECAPTQHYSNQF